MKVRNTLIFILIIFAAIAGVMAVFPKDGIRIGDSFVLKCPRVRLISIRCFRAR